MENVRTGNHRSAVANLWFTIDLRSLIYGLSDNNLVQYNTMENLHSKTDKHTVSLI